MKRCMGHIMTVPYLMFRLCLIAILLSSCGQKIDKVVRIESVKNQMKYDVTEIIVSPRSVLKIIFKNNATLDVMKHNIVVLTDESYINDVGIAALQAPNNVPSHDAIIAFTELVGPGQQVELMIMIPSEPGVYPYICTFPGHYMVMQGRIIVK